MNFLTEVLSSAEQADIESGKRNLPVITAKIASCKEEINKYIDDVYYQFRAWPKKNQQLLEAATQLSVDTQNLQLRIEEITVKDLSKKTADLTNLSLELDRSNIALGIVIHLIQIHELFMNVQEFQTNNLYVKAAFELIRVEEYINGVPEDEVTDAIDSLKLNVVTEKRALTEKINELFEENIVVIQGKPGIIKTNSIKIRKECKEFTDVLTVLGLFDKVTRPLNKFSGFIWECICKPVIDCITAVKVEDEDDFYVLNIVVKETQTRSSYQEVFNKLIKVFTFLHSHFNYQVDENVKTIAYIGNYIKLDLSEAILRDCLSDTLPSSDEECKAYKQVILDIKAFQNKVMELEIFCMESNPILDYANNMDLLFINKKCQEYSATAIAIMKKDLHDMVEVGISHDKGDPLTGNEFPESSVSRSVIELLQLAQKMFDQALQETDLSAARLICTLQSVFYQYGNIVYGHHEKLLQTIPQQVVLFRNNCMYLAHQLAQFNDTYSNVFPQAVLPIPPIFKDQPHQLRTVGGDIFLAYVEEHIKSMENTLEQYQFTSMQLSDRLNIDTDKCLRQCVRQYELLKTVWQKILPHAVYNKTLGYLLNTFCKKLIDVVVAASDIPSKNAEQVVEMYKIVLARGPKLFTDPHEVGLYVELWQKLNDLVFILSASLASISDRWADGKGPLTLHFTAEEVRSLIKALFQNTDRRAAVLSKIHY